MSDKSNKYLNFLNGFADSVFEMSPDEVKEELAEFGESRLPVKDILRKSAKKFQQRKLLAAEQVYRERRLEYFKIQQRIPERAEDQRHLLMTILDRNPRLREQMTLQHRDYTDIPDDDLPELLQEILALDVIPESSADNDEGAP